MIIYYNPDCSKCKEAKQLLEEAKCDFEIREYLKEPPSERELGELLTTLGCKAEDIVRRSEPLFIEKFADKNYNDREWIKILSEHPVLIQRPILIDGDRAVIGRPPVLVLNLLKNVGEIPKK